MDLSELKVRADEYAKFSFAGLGIPRPKSMDALEEKLIEHQFHFVFPNLDGAEKLLLLTCYFAKRGLALSVKTIGNKKANLSDTSKYELERDTNIREQDFMGLQDEVKSDIWPKLSDLQKEFVSREVFTINFG